MFSKKQNKTTTTENQYNKYKVSDRIKQMATEHSKEGLC